VYSNFEEENLICSKKLLSLNMQTPTPHATAVAYPLNGSSSLQNLEPSLDPSFFNMGMDQSTFSMTDSVELGNNFFSQLDSMIAAVKVESNALDTMRDKLKEVDNLRSQISTFTKRLIDADQLNLNLKTNLVKSQEAYNELKKQKSEVSSSSSSSVFVLFGIWFFLASVISLLLFIASFFVLFLLFALCFLLGGVNKCFFTARVRSNERCS
jgi:predicted DNA-binding ribbon-helix-helix protein